MDEKLFIKLVNIIILILIFSFLLNFFRPNLLLSTTTITGGDTASHYYSAFYLKNYLLPQGKIIGWCPGWFAGFPMFQFYPPLAFLLIAFLSYVIPLQIAFKLVTVLGIFLLPLATFFSMKLMKFKFPMPIIAAIFTLPFLFLEKNTIFGGSILSTLAGEFSYMLSFVLTVLFFGLLYKGIKEKKFLVLNAILLSLIILSHVYMAIFLLITSAFFLINKKEFISNFKYLLKTYLLAFFIVGFWTVPFLVKLPFTVFYKTTEVTHYYMGPLYNYLCPVMLIPFYLLAIFGIFKYLRKDKRIFYFTFSILTAFILFMLSTNLNVRLYDVRFLPFMYFFSLIIAAYGFSEIIKKFRFRAAWLIPLMVFFAITIWVSLSVTLIPSWVEWNYEGFEAKPMWEPYSEINEYLSEVPTSARVLPEQSAIYSSIGTIGAFELLPLFSGKPTLRGVHQEALSLPFIFYIDSEISEELSPFIHYTRSYYNRLYLDSEESKKSLPYTDYSNPNFDLENGTKHMILFNVKYVIAVSDKLKSELDKSSDYRLVKTSGPFEVYELKTNKGRYVTPLKYEPVLIKTKNWKKTSYNWFTNLDFSDTLIVFTEEVKNEDEKRFKIIMEDLDFEQSQELQKIPIDSDCYVDEYISNEELRIKTSCIGKPLLVKISYFPNWKVEGADKIYLASPSFMLIFPNQENVRLYYGKTLADKIGIIFSCIGVLVVILYLIRKFFIDSPRKHALKIRGDF